MRYLASLMAIVFLHGALGYWTLYWQPKLKAGSEAMDAIVVTTTKAGAAQA